MRFSEPVIHLDLPAQDLPSGVSFLEQSSVAETFPLHTHSFYEFFLVCAGKSIHNINGENIALDTGSFTLIRPSDVHRYSFFNHFDMELISVGVSPDHFRTALHYMNISEETILAPHLPPQIMLSGVMLRTVRKILEGIPDKTGSDTRKRYCLSFLPAFLDLFTNSRDSAVRPLPEQLSDLVYALEDPALFTAGLPALLKAAHVSQEHLTREFRKYLDITPTEYINTQRINYACSLLLSGRAIVDVCYACGFESLSYFYRVFRKIMNCTPKEFLQKNIGK